MPRWSVSSSGELWAPRATPFFWTPVGEVRHGDRVLRLGFGDLDAGPDGMIAYMTDGGVDDASGTWIVTINELVGGEVDGRLQGPWVLEFEAP